VAARVRRHRQRTARNELRHPFRQLLRLRQGQAAVRRGHQGVLPHSGHEHRRVARSELQGTERTAVRHRSGHGAVGARQVEIRRDYGRALHIRRTVHEKRGRQSERVGRHHNQEHRTDGREGRQVFKRH